MKLQKNTMLALCGVLEFAAQPGRQLSTAEIAGKYGASPHHLAKVLGRLRRAGLVKAARGSGGGYRFSGNPKRVTLLDVMRFSRALGRSRRARRGASSSAPWTRCSPRSTRPHAPRSARLRSRRC